MKTIWTIFLLLLIFLFGCTKDNQKEETTKNLTIFFVNDVHGQIDNFSKVKHIIDTERQISNVIVASSGDMFSGNPVVDNYNEKGFPIIDLMNQIGFDIATLGNHEFDYGPEFLKKRIEQSDFPWICANIDVNNSGITQPEPFKTITIDDLKITFLGLIETGGSKNTIIPSSHPWRVKDFTFEPAQNIVGNYTNLKSTEGSDLLIALSHLGYSSYEGEIGDFDLARQNYFFDMIIGGHSHAKIDTTIASIPIFQSGGYLNYLGKIELTVKNKKIKSSEFNLIDLDFYSNEDSELKAVIDDYNNLPELNEVIGYSNQYHSKWQVGCFYTDALRLYMNVDLTFQNSGGIRNTLDEGDITKREIFEISPFNNGTAIYEMTVGEVKQFLVGSGSGFYYSGVIIKKAGSEVQINDLLDRKIPDNYILTVGTNDYIPAVHSPFFPNNAKIQPLSAAETLIAYLQNINSQVNYNSCNRYFRY